MKRVRLEAKGRGFGLGILGGLGVAKFVTAVTISIGGNLIFGWLGPGLLT